MLWRRLLKTLQVAYNVIDFTEPALLPRPVLSAARRTKRGAAANGAA